MTDLQASVRDALLSILAPDDQVSSFYRKDEAPKGSQKKGLVIFVGADDVQRTPLYILGQVPEGVKAPQIALSVGDADDHDDDVYTVVGKLMSIETRVKPAYKDKAPKTAVRITLQGAGNARLILQSGLGVVFTSKLLLLLAAATSSGTIAIGSMIGVRVARGSKEPKVIFPALGYETSEGWTGVNVKDTAWDSDQFFGKSEPERDVIATDLLSTIYAAIDN